MHDLVKEAEAAAAVLRKENRAIYGDKKARQDLIEGETQLVEMAREILSQIDHCNAAAAAAAREIDLQRRLKASLEEQADALRQELADALAPIGSIMVDGATVTSKRTPPSVMIINEAAIPAQFKREVVKLVVDKAALKSALVDAPIPGAELSNGGVTIQVKR